MSRGALVASGQINHMGFRAYVIVWDWERKAEKFRHELHKVFIWFVDGKINILIAIVCLCLGSS